MRESFGENKVIEPVRLGLSGVWMSGRKNVSEGATLDYIFN